MEGCRSQQRQKPLENDSGTTEEKEKEHGRGDRRNQKQEK